MIERSNPLFLVWEIELRLSFKQEITDMKGGM